MCLRCAATVVVELGWMLLVSPRSGEKLDAYRAPPPEVAAGDGNDRRPHRVRAPAPGRRPGRRYGDTTAFRLGLDERGIGYFLPSSAPPALVPPTRSRSPRPAPPRPAPPAGHATPARPPRTHPPTARTWCSPPGVRPDGWSPGDEGPGAARTTRPQRWLGIHSPADPPGQPGHPPLVICAFDALSKRRDWVWREQACQKPCWN